MINVTIVSHEKLIFSGEATMVIAPAVMGEVGIMPGHSPFISLLNSGEIIIKMEGNTEESIFVSGGFIEVQPSVVTILSDTALRSKNIDEAQILEAKQQADVAMSNAKSDIDLAKAKISLQNATVRLELYGKVKDKLQKRGLA